MLFENEDLKASLKLPDPLWVDLEIENKTQSVMTLVIDLASFTSAKGKSSRLVTEGTKYIFAERSQPPVTIPPRGKYNKVFFAIERGSVKWGPKDLRGSSFVFGYKMGGNERFIIFSGDAIRSSMPEPDKILGKVTVKETFWNFLFLNPTEGRRKTLYNKAMLEALQKYGVNITLKNLVYEGNWNALSLIMYFSTLGFVEDATLTADVISK